VIAAMYDGTPAPFILGSAAVGALGLLSVFITERGKLFGVRTSLPQVTQP